MNSSRITRWFIYLLIVLAIVAILWSYSTASEPNEELPISQLAQQIKNGDVEELRVSGDGREVIVDYKNTQPNARTQISSVSSLEEVLVTYGVNEQDYQSGGTVIVYQAPSRWGNWLSLLGIFLPALLIIGFIYFIMRQAQGSNNQALSFCQKIGPDYYYLEPVA